jgi:hypothetical protein
VFQGKAVLFIGLSAGVGVGLFLNADSFDGGEHLTEFCGSPHSNPVIQLILIMEYRLIISALTLKMKILYRV